MSEIIPRCEMSRDCAQPVTHVGEKGYIYCAGHAATRRGHERTRALRPWELELIRAGRPVPSYHPITKREARERGLL
jgi:hypothetical protein